MNRHPKEEKLALYAGEDLTGEEKTAVTGHLNECETCRNTVAEFIEVRTYVENSLQEPLHQDLAAVRVQIMAALPIPRSRRPWWVAAPTAVALACLLFVLFVFTQQPAKPTRVQMVAISPKPIPAPPLVPVRIEPKRVKHSVQRAGIRSVALIAETDRTPVIKMNTYDPNVVILWASSKGNE